MFGENWNQDPSQPDNDHSFPGICFPKEKTPHVPLVLFSAAPSVRNACNGCPIDDFRRFFTSVNGTVDHIDILSDLIKEGPPIIRQTAYSSSNECQPVFSSCLSKTIKSFLQLKITPDHRTVSGYEDTNILQVRRKWPRQLPYDQPQKLQKL